MPIETDLRGRDETMLVFGGTGQQGGAVINALLARGRKVRAIVRNPGSAASKALASAGVQLIQGDFSDASTVRTAMAGAHGIFSVLPSSGNAGSTITDAEEVRFGKAIADIAAESGARHLVYSSAGSAGKGPTGMGHLDSKIAIEDHIRSLDIASTIVRPSTFMDLLTQPGMGLNKGRFNFFLRPDQSAQFIAAQDIGKIVAALFDDSDRFAGRTIEISGDEVTGGDLGDALSQATGRPIAYERFSEALLQSDPFLRRIAELFDNGHLTGSADIPALHRAFGTLLNVREWLAGPGNPLLKSALGTSDQPIALR